MMIEKELRNLSRNYPCNCLLRIINVDKVPLDKITRQLKEDEIVKIAFVAKNKQLLGI